MLNENFNSFPNYSDASKEALTTGLGIIFLSPKGFYGVVWFEENVRKTKILDKWNDIKEDLSKVELTIKNIKNNLQTVNLSDWFT